MNIIEFLQEKHNIFLNEQQKNAVLTLSKNTLLLAVPGSGKTTVLVSRIANLMLNFKAHSQEILTLTFSKETAKDMKNRFDFLFCDVIEDKPDFRTIHSFCLVVLKYYAQVKNRVMPHLFSNINNQKTKLLREIYHAVTKKFLSDDILDELVSHICYAKNRLLSKEERQNINQVFSDFSEIFDKYEAYKKQNNLIDYDDMLTYTYDILRKLPDILNHFCEQYHFINVDEAQDTSLVQHKIVKLLSQKASIFMVGDEDQSIYSFRGAAPEELLQWKLSYKDALIIKMEQNFRSNADIVARANFFIKQNKNRYEKEMFCDNNNENSVEILKLVDYSHQYKNIAETIKKSTNSIAILYRNNDSVIPLVDILLKENIPFYLKEHNQTFFKSAVVRDFFSYISLANNGHDIDAFKRIYYKIGLNKQVLNYVLANHEKFSNVFECAAKFDGLQSFKVEQMLYYKSAFKRILKLNPSSMIDFMCNELGYENYISHCISDNFIRTNTRQKINTLYCLANKIATYDEFKDKLTKLNAFIKEKPMQKKNTLVTLSTLHSAKGQEFDTVILLDMLKDVIPTADAVEEGLLNNPLPLENETRLFYVGVTRAKTKLIIYTSHMLNGKVVEPSKFIARFQSELYRLDSAKKSQI